MTFTVDSEGLTPAKKWILISDQTLPDVVLSALTVSPQPVSTGNRTSATVVLVNEGAITLPANIPVSLSINGVNQAIEFTTSEIAPGGSEVIEMIFTAPTTPGNFRLQCSANDERSQREISYTNNTISTTLNVDRGYSSVITCDRPVYSQSELVHISGQIYGDKVSEKDIEIYIINKGRQNIIVRTDAYGHFETEWRPYTYQGGHFAIGVCAPGENSCEPMSEFDVCAIVASKDWTVINSNPGIEAKATFTLTNLCDIDLDNLSIEVLDKPEDCNVDLNAPSVIGANSVVEVTVKATGTQATRGNKYIEIPLRISCGDLASVTKTILYYCRAINGDIRLSTQNIETNMTAGSSRDLPIEILNVGAGPTGKLSVILPNDAPWLTLVTPSEMPSLAHDEKCTVVLRLTPQDDTPLNIPLVGGPIVFSAENGNSVGVYFKVKNVTDVQGHLRVDVCDESTYYDAASPHVAEALVSVYTPHDHQLVYSGSTGADGICEADLNAGNYLLTVAAPGHASESKDIYISPGADNDYTINLSYIGVTVDMRWHHIDITDEYSIKCMAKLQTDVPVPQVLIEVPQRIEVNALAAGESLLFEATLVNKGLITASDVSIILPDNMSNVYFECLRDMPVDLGPGESVVVPILVTKKTAQTAPATHNVKPIENDPCAGEIGTLCYWDCGLDRKWHKYYKALQFGACRTDVDGNIIPYDRDSGLGLYGPDGWGLGSIYPVPHTGFGDYITPGATKGLWDITKADQGCEPCQNKFLLALAECTPYLGEAIRAGKKAWSIFDCVGSFTSSMDMARKLKNCEFTKQYAPVYEMMEYLFGYLKRAESGTLTDDDLENSYKLMGKLYDNMLKGLGEDLRNELNNMSGDNRVLIPDLPIDEMKGMSKALQDIAKEFDADAQGPDLAKLAEHTSTLMEKFGKSLQHFDETKDLGELLLKPVRKYKKLKCLVDLFGKCDLEGSPASRAGAQSYPSYIEDFQQSLKSYLTMVSNNDSISALIIGDRLMEYPGYQVYPLMYYLDDFDVEHYDILSDRLVWAFKPQGFSDDDFKAFLLRMTQLENESDCAKAIDVDALQALYQQSSKEIDFMRESGCPDLYEMITTKMEETLTKLGEYRSTVCASVSLNFAQRMTMTREAILGTLTIGNGHQENPMENITLALDIRNSEGGSAMSKFQIAVKGLEGMEGSLNMSDGWSLDASATGYAEILVIPTNEAAPVESVVYYFGGTLSYVDPFTGSNKSIDLIPTPLSVNPSPMLDLDYFLQRDILGDDPMTELVETSLPAEFALLITNHGHGTAKDITIQTRQPQIMENDKGLDIRLQMLASCVNGSDKLISPSVDGMFVNNFDDIAPGASAYAQWWFTSSLMGHFDEYDISFKHITNYDNPDLSLISTVKIHELIHSLRVDTEASNQPVIGFLTNDVVDQDDTPDHIYISDGTVHDVSVASRSVIKDVSDRQFSLTVTPGREVWNYSSLSDPMYGKGDLVRVVRVADGAELDPSRVWLTDRILRDGQPTLYEYNLHIIDEFADGMPQTYEMTFVPRPKVELRVEQFLGLSENTMVITQPVDTVTICFNKPIDGATFSIDDLTLVRDDTQIDLSDLSIEALDGLSYAIILGNAAVDNGQYVLTVNTSGITDAEGYTGHLLEKAAWVVRSNNAVDLEICIEPNQGGNVSHSTGSYEWGSPVELVATAAEGYVFKGWAIDDDIVATDPQLNLYPTTDATITAKFALRSHVLTIAVDGNGKVNGAYNGYYQYGDSVKISASADGGWVLDHWVVNGTYAGHNLDLALSIDDDITIEAVFIRLDAHNELSLPVGWSWISSNISDMDATTPYNLLYGIVDNVDRMVSADGIIVREPDTRFFYGDILSIKPECAYKLKLNKASELCLSGQAYSPYNVRLQLSEGWNWIGYVPIYPSAPDVALIGLNPEENDVIKSKQGFAVYVEGQWIGTLETMRPGEGYMYYANEPKDFTFPYIPESEIQYIDTAAKDNTPYDPWTLAENMYPDNMVIIATLSPSEYNLTADSYIVGAFVDDECRGISRIVDDRLFITVHGESVGDTISFKVFDTVTREITDLDVTTQFEDICLGTYKSPFPLAVDCLQDISISDRHKFMLYPNPAHDRVSIKGDTSRVTGYKLISMSGQILSVQEADYDTDGYIDVSALLSGWYLLAIYTDSDITYCKFFKD